MKRSKFGYAAAIAVLPLGLLGCASNDRRVERDGAPSDYVVATPTTQVQSAFLAAPSNAKSRDATIATNLPSVVRSGIHARFPEATILDMRQGSADEWVVYVQTDGAIRELHVRADDGLVLQSDNALTTQMAINALPSAVKTVANSRQPGGIIYNVEQVGDAQPATYRVYSLSGGEQYFVDANESGLFLAEGRASDASRAYFATSPVSDGNRVQAAEVSGWREKNRPDFRNETMTRDRQRDESQMRRESDKDGRDGNHDRENDSEELHNPR